MNGKSSESTKAADQVNDVMDCRADCGACCIAPSISSPIPGMPHGKPAGIPCVQLTGECASAIFGRPERPEVCRRQRCAVRTAKRHWQLMALESATRPL